jgi:hypothetical protein
VTAAAAFAASGERFGAVVSWLDGTEAGRLTHGELEAQLAAAGRELIRQLLQDHLDLRAAREERCSVVTGADRVTRSRAESGHQRPLATVFGQVRVTRMAYRAPGAANLYPADAALNLPAGKYSHGLRRLAAAQAARGSFGDGTEAIRRSAGLRIGKRQVENLARAAAADVDSFYAAARPPAASAAATDVLVISADGKGIIMRPGSLRPRARQNAARNRAKLATRLTRGEVRHHKRMAEVGAVYDITPAPRDPASIIARPGAGPPQPAAPAPAARGKWLTASIAAEIRHVIAAVFDEAERRDPGHTRPWVALADGNPHQIRRITAEAARRDAPVTILIDFIHVLEYLWQAAWALHREADPAAETWVAAHARAILHGHTPHVAAAIRAAASTLTGARQAAAAQAARYLDTKHPYLGYPRALTAGWPISTGVIEGACRYLVKDRMDITGARWSVPGAEAILKLRALTANGDFDTYWTHHLQQEQHRNHHTRYLNSATPRAA